MKALVLFQSRFGECFELAKAMQSAATEAGADVVLKQVRDAVPAEELEKNPKIKEAQEALNSIPEVTVEELGEYHAIALVLPCCFGGLGKEMKQLLSEKAATLWSRGVLAGKIATVRCCACMQGDGESTEQQRDDTTLAAHMTLLHHAMLLAHIQCDSSLTAAQEIEQAKEQAKAWANVSRTKKD